MADPRGIVTLKAGSKKYDLSLPINRICDMEADFSEARGVEMDIRMIGVQLEGASFRSLRKVIFHGLAEAWPDKGGDLTEERAGELMQAAGMDETARVVGDLWRETFPQPAAADEDDEGGEEGGGEDGAAAPANRKTRRAANAGKAEKK